MEPWQKPETLISWFLIIIILFIILLVFIFLLIRLSYRKMLEKKNILFQEKLKYEKELQSAIISVQDEERKNIAGELHDQISNKLNLLVLKMNTISQNATAADLEFLKSEMKLMILKNRDISHYLFPVEIENLGLLLTLQDVSIKYRTDDFCIDIFYNYPITFTSKQCEMQLYRVIQESITNVVKHSQATELNIHFRPFKNRLCILLQDDGIGFDLDKVKLGLGMNTIDTRLKSINAQFKFKSKHLKGSRLIIML